MTRYACVLSGGSIGEDKPTKIFERKEDAQLYGKSWVKSFSGGSRSYYRPRYQVRRISDYEEISMKKGEIPWWMKL